jgi:hypothetical protein
MPIEMYGSDEAGHLMLLDDPTPERTSGAPPAPPAGEPPLPAADAPPPAETAVAPPPPATAPPADELAALKRLIEERAARDAQRETQVDTMLRVLRGEEVPPPPTAPAGPPPRPKAEDFASQEAFDAAFDTYIDARADWKAEQKVTAAQQATQQQQAQLTREQAVKQAEEAFVKDHPDYVEVVTQGLVNKTPQAFRQLIMLSDDAPAVAYALARDEALLGRLMQMPPPQLLYALGRLSSQHGGSAPPPDQAAPAPPAGGTPPAGAPGSGPGQALPPAGVVPGVPGGEGRPKPPPPRPLSGTGVAPVGGFREDMSQAEYRVWRAQGAA